MRSEEEMFPPETVDEQVEQLSRSRYAVPARQSRTADVRLVQHLHRLYELEQADAHSVARVQRHLEQQGWLAPEGRQKQTSGGGRRPGRRSTPLPQIQAAAHREQPTRRQRGWLFRLAAIAAVLLVIALVGGLLTGVVLVRQGNGSKPILTATATPLPLHLTLSSNLSSITMLSPAEGWAVGYEGASGPPLLLHWLKAAWRKEPLPAISIVPQVITMVSPTDGWLGGADSPDSSGAVNGVMLHYSGGTWTQVPLPSDAGPIAGIAMVSSTEGWAVDTTSADHGHAQILHYRQGTWTVALTGADYTSFTSIAMVSPTEGWAAGPSQPDGYLWHYVQGAWKQVTLNDPTHADLEYLSMLSPDDGWGIGGYLTAKQQKDEATPHLAGALWHYTGGQWRVVQQYQDVPATHLVQLFALQAVAPGDVWVSESDGSSGPHFLHEINGTWQKVAAPIRQNITSIAFVSANEGWAVGAAGQILHYQSGTWNDYPAQS